MHICQGSGEVHYIISPLLAEVSVLVDYTIDYSMIIIMNRTDNVHQQVML